MSSSFCPQNCCFLFDMLLFFVVYRCPRDVVTSLLSAYGEENEEKFNSYCFPGSGTKILDFIKGHGFMSRNEFIFHKQISGSRRTRVIAFWDKRAIAFDLEYQVPNGEWLVVNIMF